MDSKLIFVPEGMSYINALQALWLGAKFSNYYDNRPGDKKLAESDVSTPQKIASYIRSRRELFVDFSGGKLIKVDFKKFPQIDVTQYDEKYGKGAASRAISSYSEVPSQNRIDAGDQYQFSQDFPTVNKNSNQFYIVLIIIIITGAIFYGGQIKLK